MGKRGAMGAMVGARGRCAVHASIMCVIPLFATCLCVHVMAMRACDCDCAHCPRGEMAVAHDHLIPQTHVCQVRVHAIALLWSLVSDEGSARLSAPQAVTVHPLAFTRTAPVDLALDHAR